MSGRDAHRVARALIDGRFVPTTGAEASLTTPVDGSAHGAVRFAGAAEVDGALNAALRARPAAEALPVAARVGALRRLADRMEADGGELAALVTAENGCPARQAVALQVGAAVGLLRAYAELAETHVFEERRAAFRGGHTLVRKLPVGVAVGIVPWNVPHFLACMKLAPAIAAGVPIVLKPAPETSLSGDRLAALLAELDLPPGMLGVLPGDAQVGQALVGDPRVDKVSFTGSTAAGRAIAEVCARRFARCTLELGGKSAAVLLDDVDLDRALPQLFLATLQNNGQVCGAQSRLLVPRSRARELVDALAAFFESLVVGDPRDDRTQVGPVVSARQRDRILGYLALGPEEGATVAAGGGPGPGPGFTVQPTLFADANNRMRIAREEIFGPVVTVIDYRDEADAVALANDSEMGLSGSVWSADPDRALAVARRLRTGTVGLGTKRILDFGSPFGGFRASGIGRELGPEGIDAFLETQTLLIPDPG